jgi:uncharacterized protein (DUF983 family)
MKMLGKILGTVVGAVAAKKLAENGLPCMFGHKWNGCTCERCGTVRDAHHQMVSVPGECTQRCAICGKTGKTHHKYKKDPDTGDYICVVCGMSKKDENKDEARALMILFGMLGVIGLVGMLSWLAQEHWNFLMVLIVLIIMAIITAIVLWFRHLKRQQDIEILKANISKIGEDEAERRAEKYREWR